MQYASAPYLPLEQSCLCDLIVWAGAHVIEGTMVCASQPLLSAMFKMPESC